MAEVDEIRDFLQELSATDGDMDPGALNVLYRAAAAIEDIAGAKCRALIDLAGHRPLLQAFMSDGWSCDMRSRDMSSAGDVSVRRTGRLRTEFIVQRAILKTKIGLETHIAFRVNRPRPLAGKRCGDMWSAGCEFIAMPKLCGHRGVTINLYLQDGLFAKPFGKRMVARHDLFFEE